MQEEKLLIRQRVSAKYAFLLTDKGESFFKELSIETDALQKNGGTFAKACLDFSERKHHVGGKLGVAFLKMMVEKGWIQRRKESRVHRITGKGREMLKKRLGITF